MKSIDTPDGGTSFDSAPTSSLRHRSRRRELDALSVAGAASRSATVGSPISTHRQAYPGSVFAGGVPMTATCSFEFNDMPDSILLGWLNAREQRPNVLIECSSAAADTAMRHLMTWCSLPFRYCALPGRLELPTTPKGTVLLKDVAAMTLSQQVVLYDWLSAVKGGIQVVSISTTSLTSLVEDGEFLEGLFYRLNVIRLDAQQGTRPAPLDAWQDARARMA